MRVVVIIQQLREQSGGAIYSGDCKRIFMKIKNDSEEWKEGSVKNDTEQNIIRIVSQDLSAGTSPSQPREIGKITFHRHKPRPRNFLGRLLNFNTRKNRD
jgi:hypothetical protein